MAERKGSNLSYIDVKPTEDKVLIPGKLYAMDLEIYDYNDLYKLRGKDGFSKEEQNDMEAALRAALTEHGHVCEFAEFSMQTLPGETVFHPIFNTYGTIDLMSSSWTMPALPKKIIRVYFRVRSITVFVIFTLTVAVLTAALVIGEPRLVRILEAVDQPFTTAKDLGLGIIQEPRKIIELGVMAFIPVLALMAGVGYFILRKKAV